MEDNSPLIKPPPRGRKQTINTLKGSFGNRFEQTKTKIDNIDLQKVQHVAKQVHKVSKTATVEIKGKTTELQKKTFEMRDKAKSPALLIKGPASAPSISNLKKSTFGISLNVVLQKCGHSLPPFIEKVCLYLEVSKKIEEVGIFRESGNRTEIEKYKLILDQEQDIPYWSISPYTLCDLLKIYFRELPDALLTGELYDCFLAKAEIATKMGNSTNIDLNNDLLRTLPDPNKCLLKRLLMFLKEVSKRSQKNKMGVANLGLIFGPNILKSPPGRSNDLLSDIPLITSIACSLISQCDKLFKDTPIVKHYVGLSKVDYDYQPKTEHELHIKVGDVLWITEKHSSGWWKAEREGVVGFVPATFVSDLLS